MKRWMMCMLIPVLFGCQEELDSDPLIQADQWRLAEFHPTLWRENPTPSGVCDSAIGIDPVAAVERLKVDLTDCPQLTLVQPTGHDLAAGETIEIDFYHFGSTVENVGDARVVVAIGEQRIMDRTISVLNNSALLPSRFSIPNRIPEGTPIRILMADPGDSAYSAWVVRRIDCLPVHPAKLSPSDETGFCPMFSESLL